VAAGRSASTYAFERLPSQQAGRWSRKLESMAPALAAVAGFNERGRPEVRRCHVQVGARINRYDVSPYDDPFWWHGGCVPYRATATGYGAVLGPPGYFGHATTTRPTTTARWRC
jgi:hypothetical protein